MLFFWGITSPVSWSAKKHRGIVAVSSAESEIVQISETIKQVLRLQPLVIHLGFTCIEQSTVLFCDNEPASHIILKNPMHSGRTKHIDIKVKF